MNTQATKTVPAITSAINEMMLTLEFANGKSLKVDASLLIDTIQRDALMHGLKQKLVDAAAISRNPETGRSATIEDKFNAVKEVADRLVAGQWNKLRGDGTSSAGGLLFKALCQVYDRKTPEEIRAFLESRTDAEKAALRTNPKIAPVIAVLKATSDKPSTIDTDAMLGSLE